MLLPLISLALGCESVLTLFFLVWGKQMRIDSRLHIQPILDSKIKIPALFFLGY